MLAWFRPEGVVDAFAPGRGSVAKVVFATGTAAQAFLRQTRTSAGGNSLWMEEQGRHIWLAPERTLREADSARPISYAKAILLKHWPAGLPQSHMDVGWAKGIVWIGPARVVVRTPELRLAWNKEVLSLAGPRLQHCCNGPRDAVRDPPLCTLVECC